MLDEFFAEAQGKLINSKQLPTQKAFIQKLSSTLLALKLILSKLLLILF